MSLVPSGKYWLASMVIAALAGCITPTSLIPPSPAPGGINLSGRISVKIEPGPANPDAKVQSITAQFELEGWPDDGLLSLSTPLGTRMAQARWVGKQAELIGPDGLRRDGHIDQLISEVLGQDIPVGALMSWLQGRPASDTPSAPLPAPDQGFDQLGWRINLNRWNDRLVVATREGVDLITVRVKLDPGTAAIDASRSPQP